MGRIVRSGTVDDVVKICEIAVVERNYRSKLEIGCDTKDRSQPVIRLL